MFGIGRKLKRAASRAEKSVRSAGSGIESRIRNTASGVKSMYTHPGATIKNELVRGRGRISAAADKAGGQAERAVKRSASETAKITGTQALLEGTKKQLDKLSPDEQAAPPIPEPAPMPIPDEQLSLVARRRARAQRRGARSTSILSDGGNLG